MIQRKKLPDFEGAWPIDLLEAVSKLFEGGVTPARYRDLWEAQADQQDFDIEDDDL